VSVFRSSRRRRRSSATSSGRDPLRPGRGLEPAYPRWLGWIVVVAGAGSITRVLTIIFPTVITLWLVEMNILVLRKAPALERAITQDL
jgi:hypothetical protein